MDIDRLVYIKNCMPRNAPKMCQLHVARWVVFAVVLVSLVINLPYFFIFEIKGGEIRTTTFFYTRYVITIVFHLRVCAFTIPQKIPGIQQHQAGHSIGVDYIPCCQQCFTDWFNKAMGESARLQQTAPF